MGKSKEMPKNSKQQMNTVYYWEHCGMSLDRNKLNQLRAEEDYNREFHQHLESIIEFAEQRDPITGNPANSLNKVYWDKNHGGSKF